MINLKVEAQQDEIIQDKLGNTFLLLKLKSKLFIFFPKDAALDLVVDWWRQIGARYQSFSLKFSFDIIIEVTDALNKRPDMLNKLYSKVVPEIRKTNPNRIIFISPILRSAPGKTIFVSKLHFHFIQPDLTTFRTNTRRKFNVIRYVLVVYPLNNVLLKFVCL